MDCYSRERILEYVEIAKHKGLFGYWKDIGDVLLVVVDGRSADKDEHNALFGELQLQFEERSEEEVRDETIQPGGGVRIAYSIKAMGVKVILSGDYELNLNLIRELHLVPAAGII